MPDASFFQAFNDFSEHTKPFFPYKSADETHQDVVIAHTMRTPPLQRAEGRIETRGIDTTLPEAQPVINIVRAKNLRHRLRRHVDVLTLFIEISEIPPHNRFEGAHSVVLEIGAEMCMVGGDDRYIPALGHLQRAIPQQIGCSDMEEIRLELDQSLTR
jgi:hypothetical protein